MAIKNLHHTIGRGCGGDVSVTWGSIQEVEHNGRTVVFAQARPGGERRKPYIIVPGYRASAYKREGNATSIDVETIPPSDQPAIKAKIEPIGEGIINFW